MRTSLRAVLAVLMVFAGSSAMAQQAGAEIPGVSIAPVTGITESVSSIMDRDRTQAVVPSTPRESKMEFEPIVKWKGNGNGPDVWGR